MAHATVTLDGALDELYAASPADFTARRDALAKQLKTEGDAAAAAELKGQRKPTQIAYVLNQLARKHEDDLAELVDVGRELARAQRKALRGEAGHDLREAITRQRAVVSSLTAKTAALMAELGVSPTGHLDEVAGALQAALVDPAVGAKLEEGRLDKVPAPAAGFPGAAPQVEEVVERAPAKPTKPAAKAKPTAKPEADAKAKPKPKPSKTHAPAVHARAAEKSKAELREEARAKAKEIAEAKRRAAEEARAAAEAERKERARAERKAAAEAAGTEAAARAAAADEAEREADGHTAQAKKLEDEARALATEAKRLAAEAKRVAREAESARRAAAEAAAGAARATKEARSARSAADRALKDAKSAEARL